MMARFPATGQRPAMRKTYTTVFTRAEWALIEPLLSLQHRWDAKHAILTSVEVIDTILDIPKNGCTWPDLLGDF